MLPYSNPYFSIRTTLCIVAALSLAACAGDLSSNKKKAEINKPVVGEIKTKTKFKAGKRYGPASERVVRSALAPVPRGGGRAVVGKPYKINGRWYRPRRDPNYDRVGIASWYGPNFHGRKTANGEIYDQTYLSAAHPTLPLPSYVRVTHLKNDRSVIVRVNDRGPFHKSRIIDLSYRTAELLGTRAGGIAKVRVQYIGPAPVHGKDEKYLVASYKGPGSVEPSKLAARKKLLAYAGLPEDDALIAQALGEDFVETPTTSEKEPARIVLASNEGSTPALQPSQSTPRVISNKTEPATAQSGSAPAIGGPLVLTPSALIPVSQPASPLIIPQPSNSRPLGDAFWPVNTSAKRINGIFDQLVHDNETSDGVRRLIDVGAFEDKAYAIELVDALNHLGEISLSTELKNNIPTTKIELKTYSPFTLKAVHEIAPGAVVSQ